MLQLLPPDEHTEFWTMAMKNPPHPGKLVLDECLTPLGLTITEAAEGLDVTRQTLSRVINGQTGISPTMAVRLSKAFGGSPESWLRQQMLFDLAQVHKRSDEIKVQRFNASRLTLRKA
jgi:addiction module HigA family antidote